VTNYTSGGNSASTSAPATPSNRYPGCDTDDITIGSYTVAACNVGSSIAGTTSASN
jgi:hypothetical protein